MTDKQNIFKLLSYRNLHHSDTQMLVHGSALVTIQLTQGTFKTTDSGILLPNNLIYQVLFYLGGRVDNMNILYLF